LGRHKKDREEALIRWRRKQVAERWFSGQDVKTIAEALKVHPDTIYADRDWIESHADDLMRNYIVKTVPHIINRSLYQLDIANQEAMKILKDPKTTLPKDKLAASLAVSSNAKIVVDIITNNKGLIDAALELDGTVKQKAEEYLKSDNDNELSQESTGTDTDPERVF
jgi:hypothetical protein